MGRRTAAMFCGEHQSADLRDTVIEQSKAEQAKLERKNVLAALIAQCDMTAPPPADMAPWDLAPPVSGEVL